jgi:hypothetical protein
VEAILQLEEAEAADLLAAEEKAEAQCPRMPHKSPSHLQQTSELWEQAYTDRRQARDFIEELQSYIRVNLGVTGFKSPIRKVALALTFIKGPEVAR